MKKKIFKKLFLLALSFVFIFSLIPTASVLADDYDDYYDDVIVTDKKSKAKYELDLDDREAEYLKPTDSKAKSANIPATITYKGKKYRVTSIDDGAFKNNRNLTKVVIGKYVEDIGERAFYKCKNLKSITIKTTRLSYDDVEYQAFAQTSSKARVKVPASKYKLYKKLLIARGLSSKAKVVK